jgi:DNA polymerase eta
LATLIDASDHVLFSRLTGISMEIPLAVQQWQSLIAVNYAARKFGISRHDNVVEGVT